jgi:hypothetical protein
VIVRLIGAILLEQNDEWAVSRRYMSLETLAGLCDDPQVSNKAIPAAHAEGAASTHETCDLALEHADRTGGRHRPMRAQIT